MSSNLWVILVPVYKPAPGGSAAYSETIAHELASCGDDVLIVSEAFPGQPEKEILISHQSEGGGTAHVHRFLPYRAGRAKKDWRSFLAYGHANLLYLRIPNLIRKTLRRGNYASLTILVHSGFFYNPSLLDGMLPVLGKLIPGRTRLVADVRDYQYPEKKLSLFRHFDSICTSSIDLAKDLARREPSIADRLRPIAMPFVGPAEPSADQIAAVAERYGLVRGRYLFNPNGITDSKHYPVMRETIPLVRVHSGLEDVVLVTAGRDRDRRVEDSAAEVAGLAKFVGPIAHTEVLALMGGALATIVLSNREAISRSALEAMWIGGRVILPDLTEFRQDCPEHVCAEVTPEKVTEMVVGLAQKELPKFRFDRHGAESFVPAYRDMIWAGAKTHML